MSSWSDSVTDDTQPFKPSSRPTRRSYIPPHLRTSNGVSTLHITRSFDQVNRFTNPNPGRPVRARGRGRGRGRGLGRGGRYWGPGRQSQNPQTPFDMNSKFDDLEIIDRNVVENEYVSTNVVAGDGNDGGGGINFDAYEDIPVETSGSNIPPPVNSFDDVDLGEGLSENIKRCKYVKPTPIQKHAIPIALAGRDLMACAQTGSGKTAAFCFPIISGILRSKQPNSDMGLFSGSRIAHPLALILSPTRELSCQIHEEAKKFAYQTGVKVAVAYGGAPISQQLRNLECGVDILVATPGRLVDMIERARVSLSSIKFLALDEADRMLDMGFEPQIRRIVEQMDMPSPGVRQTMLFSATFPDVIQRLAADFLSDYIFLSVGRVGSSTDLIIQKVEYIPDMDKRRHLINILQEQRMKGTHGKHALTLVFVETKRSADAIEHHLSRNGFPSTAIHGDKVQMERERALRSFKTGVTPIMVATDVAARGLDIPNVAHVINFDLPKDIDDYVHRIGRTGRAGKTGIATAFFDDKNLPLARSLVNLMQEANQEVPPWLAQYAETSYGSSSNGRSRRYGGGKFGGHDFRSASRSSNYSYSYPTSSYGGEASHSVPAHAYGYDYGSVVANGWE
ncbi:DEAD/DEAH box helicase domain [Dillenia turbinata]|uniref:RNA helicase n=1 Tax=Dillenia turbinata TaxID=194707 RepID=A0AAN8W8F7_9MAGN